MNNKIWCIISTIKNSLVSNKRIIREKRQKNCEAILNILWDEGFILGYKTCKLNSKYIIIFLKYNENYPVIKSIKSISKPSTKIYYSSKQLWKLNIHQALIILSTNKGIFSSEECKKLKLGGEPIFIIK